MPGIDGIELAQRATAHLPDIKVLFITGFAAVALNAQKTGANRNAKILCKPFHLRKLVQELPGSSRKRPRKQAISPGDRAGYTASPARRRLVLAITARKR